MPLSPFHLGPAILLGLIILRYVDLPTLIIANVIIDIEPMFILLFNLDFTHHQFLHTFLGGTLVVFTLTWIMKKVRIKFSPLLSFFKIEQKASLKSILVAASSGIYMHILLDSRIYMDIRPFYPLEVNPFLNGILSSVIDVYMFCIWSFIGGIIVYTIRLVMLKIMSINMVK